MSAARAAVLRAATPAIACGVEQSDSGHVEESEVNELARRYVSVVLAIGQHDPDYVDAYYGPEELRPTGSKRPLAEIDRDAASIEAALKAGAGESAAEGDPGNDLHRLRDQYLLRQVASARTRLAMLSGRKLSFDEESKALYDAVAPVKTGADFEAVLQELDHRLPGPGALIARYNAFRDRFVIPKERLDSTFHAAIQGCRSRTLAHVTLPPTESFTVEYVTNKSWSGYNWYQGNYRSLIQVNTDLPIFVDRAIDLACHEGYPGHHVYNVLLEHHLVRNRGWIEYSVYPLFSPQSLIAEGTANYGIEVAFPHEDRMDFERRVIFPAAGLDPADVEAYYTVQSLVERLSYASNEAARQYLDGRIDAATAAARLMAWGLYSKPRAEQRVRFIDQYRSYVVNYNLGKDLVAAHVEAVAGAPDPARRWAAFIGLLSSPRLPSGLVTGH
jgi:hypothetical protein